MASQMRAGRDAASAAGKRLRFGSFLGSSGQDTRSTNMSKQNGTALASCPISWLLLCATSIFVHFLGSTEASVLLCATCSDLMCPARALSSSSLWWDAVAQSKRRCHQRPFFSCPATELSGQKHGSVLGFTGHDGYHAPLCMEWGCLADVH